MSAPEIWRDIPGYEGRYRASTLGRIWSLVRGRPLSPSLHRDWYAKVNLRDGAGGYRTFHVHTLVGLAFLGPRPSSCFVDHRDCDHTNDRADNLRYLTPAESNLNRQRCGNSRQYTGTPNVYYHGRGGYFARVNHKRLGSFDSKEAARKAVDRFRKMEALLLLSE